ncbi:ABC transporter permease [Nocardia panacis]|uniref:ABC transporter permease n=1 Tax=Nocardia panacis TaxID=2340916 RepID=UPI00131546C9|nr:ABC transporter permease [Nocardia panacis]
MAALLIIPVFFSSALVPTETMPGWLRIITTDQPMTHAVDALRGLLLGAPMGDHLWLAVLEFGGISSVACLLAGVLFRRSTR